MWKVNRIEDNEFIVLRLSGRFEGGQLQQLRETFEQHADGHNLALDLEGVRLVDGEVVAFLGDCEAQGVNLRNCPDYIRDWIDARCAGGGTENAAAPRRDSEAF